MKRSFKFVNQFPTVTPDDCGAAHNAASWRRAPDSQTNGYAALRQGKRMFSTSRLFLAALATTLSLAQEAPEVPPEKRVMEGAKLMGTIHVETQAQWLGLATEIYK
jgi:hypothetical protein